MDVFNGQSVAATNFLAQVSREDKFTETDIPCTARVTVYDAFFKSMYRGTSLPVPYLEILGNIDSVYIEDTNRYFPCGTNEMNFMSGHSQDVVVRYFLSNQELTDLVSMGLYEAGFQPPANLVNNVIEIPIEITYKGVYDTPCCIVEIQNAHELDTTTHNAFVNGRQIEGNGYDGIFLGCKTIEGLTPDTVYDFNVDFGYERHKQIEANYDRPVEQQVEEVVEPELSAEEQAEMKHIEAVNEQISAEANKHADRLLNVDKHDIKNFLQEVKSVAEAEDAKNKPVDNFASMWDEFNGNAGGQANAEEPNRLSKSYEVLFTMAKDKAESDAMLKQKEDEKSGKKSADAARSVDIAQDNLALNEGRTDIAGFGSNVSDANKLKEKKDEKSGKKAAEAARRVDIAQDNQALNEGRTDIAGFGSNNSSKNTAAADLLAGLLKPSNKPSGPSL